MSTPPSLALWCSIKIPFTFCCGLREELAITSYINSARNRYAEESKTKQERLNAVSVELLYKAEKNQSFAVKGDTYKMLKNSKINNSERKKSNFLPVTINLFSKEGTEGDSYKNTSLKSPNKPKTFWNPKENSNKYSPIRFSNKNFKLNEYDSDLFESFSNKDHDSWISEMSPWAEKDLEEINAAYDEVEETINQISRKTKKVDKASENDVNVKTFSEKNSPKNLETSKTSNWLHKYQDKLDLDKKKSVDFAELFSTLDFSEPFSLRKLQQLYPKKSISSVRKKVYLSEEEYYKEKLAKLYLIKCGISLK